MSANTPWDFVVSRRNPSLSRLQPSEPADGPLEPGEVEFLVERFALSANNLTYAASGESLGYWSLFGASDGWGIVPAWGYAVARRSRCEHAPEGARVFGLVPMGSRFRLRPRRVRLGLLDQSPQRQDLNPAYNLYADAPAGDLIEDELVAALRPLAILGFVLADHLAGADLPAAPAVVVTSASSRTAISLGWMLGREQGRRRIGVSSPRNRRFAADSGAFDDTLVYGDAPPVADTAWVLVDFTGDPDVVARTTLAAGRPPLRVVQVGATHTGTAGAWPSGSGDVFFAPDHIQSRIAAWGPQVFETRFRAAFDGFLLGFGGRLAIARGHGPAALTASWGRLLAGRSDPGEAVIIVPGAGRP